MPTKPLQIQVIERPTALVLVLAGDAGVGEIESLRRVVDDAMTRPSKRVIVDLSRLDFIASLGLGQLVRLALSVRARGGQFRLCAAHDGILAAVLKSRLSDLMPMFRDLADAER